MYALISLNVNTLCKLVSMSSNKILIGFLRHARGQGQSRLLLGACVCSVFMSPSIHRFTKNEKREDEGEDKSCCKEAEYDGFEEREHLLEFSDGVDGRSDDGEFVFVFIGVPVCCPLDGIVVLPRTDNICLAGDGRYLSDNLKLHGIVKVLCVVPTYDMDEIAYSNFRFLGSWHGLPVSLRKSLGLVDSQARPVVLGGLSPPVAQP